MRALSRRNDDPERASRPFDAERDGFVMGEAGGIVVLEELEHARQARRQGLRRADRLRALVGCPAHHRARPDRPPPGAGDDHGDGRRGHRRATRSTTSTRTAPRRPIGDASETRVIKIALGEEKARRTPVSSTKGATGHCLGASGRDRGHHLDARRPAGRRPADDQLRSARSRVRPRLHPERGARVEDGRRALEQLRLRRPQRLPRDQEVHRLVASAGRRSTSTGRSSTGTAGSGASSTRLWPDADAAELLHRYHEIEPRVELEGSLALPGGAAAVARPAGRERGARASRR